MSCQFQNCMNQVEYECISCSEKSFFCNEHARIHSKISKHKVSFIDDDTLQKLRYHFLISKKAECINKVNKDTQEVIAAIKVISRVVINGIKESKDLTNFKPILFNQHKISLVIKEIKLLTQDSEVLPADNSENLSFKLEKKYKKIKEKCKELEEMNKKLEIEKGVLIEQNRLELRYLKEENERISKKNEELSTEINLIKLKFSSQHQIIPKQNESNDCRRQGFDYLEVNRMTKTEKCSFAISFFDLRKDLDQVFDELLISNDGKYGFLCIKYLGMLK